MSVRLCKVHKTAHLQSPNGQFCGIDGNVAFEDTVFEVFLLQILSDQYWETIRTSDGLNLGQGSSHVLADSPLDGIAQCW